MSAISKEELRAKCEAEGIDFSKVCVCAPRWSESKPRSPDALSALITCDAIIRNDGSAVFLDGMMSADGRGMASQHVNRGAVPAADWSAYVAERTQLPK